ncbi:Hsp20/alpha crystallin family protein [Arboricoccus pini]|uniref:Hsp20/alpha crystallin family protein n=1 Tax=Arboricoccus pini TaxID=1963835 RepID=A0A212R7W1_9PROT|nr:Hsp20/alpha crystallin family protein [Arboricoccus pini]SNB68237.1 Hsp20/alpha crystallin family protein [Arboricoccus pini]
MRGIDRNWMWAEALGRIERAERLHRQYFRPNAQRQGSRTPSWEPPLDMVETETEVLILIALPGVDLTRVETTIEGDTLVVLGERRLPVQLASALVHRLELPRGHFERRLRLPAGRYGSVSREEALGCLLVILSKA